MSFGKKYFSSYKSNNGYDYYLEIWVFGQTDPAYEKRLGEGGPVIQYETDTEDRFSPILTSQCRIPFLVENVIESQFIDSLRTDFQERQIYVHIYRESQSGYASVAPLWSGFMLMDIGEGQDKSFPYVQELVFVDGLSLLKNIDFVDRNVSGGTPPFEERVQGNYAVENMYFGPSSYIFWFREILRKSGAALTSNGATQDYKISTSVNWYNGDMDSLGQSQDPLEKTKCVVSMFHTKDDQDVFYPENCYNVLKELLRHWGARITYWKHRFYIVQIPEYITAESGLIDAPININSRIYNESGSFSGSQNHTGSTFWTRYFQTISNTTISKLVGTKYNYLPILKQINANFLSFTGENKFGGFPFGPNATSQEVFQGTLNNPSNADFLFVSIPTNWAWDLSQASSSFSPTDGWWMQIKFNFYAVQDDGAGNLSYFYLQYRTSTGKYFWVDAANWSPLGATSPRYVVRSFNITETAYVGFEASIPFEDSSGNPITMDGAWSFFIDIEDYGTSGSNPGSFYLNNSGYGGVPQRMRNPNVRIQVPAGSGNFSGTISWSNTLQDPQGILTTSSTVNPAGFNAGTATDDIQFDTSSPFVGKLQLIKSGQSSSYGSTLNVYNNTTTASQANSEIFDMGTLLWGDSVSYARSSLQVDNGTNFVNTNPNGLWGRGTLSGTKTFTQLLIDEFLSGQTKITISPTMRLGVGVANKNETVVGVTRPRYVNPIGKLRELRSNATDPEYFFRRGAFYTLLDEWDYEGYQIIRNTPTTTTQTNNMGNLGGSQVNAQASSAPLQNKISQSLAQNSPIAYLRQPVPSVGSNVAVNGNFTTASDWSLGTGWTIDTTESKAKFSATGSTSDLVQSVLEIEKTYQINFKVEVTSGTLSVKAGTTSSTVVVSTSGNYSLYVQCLGNTQIKFQAGTTFTGNITHITIKEQKTLTSLPINAIGSAVIKAGDTFNVINDNEDQIIKLTATANQGASDTSISVQSLPLFDDIVEQSYILINQEDLAAQYQNKTKGTVGGFDITATSIDSGSVAISSYIDDDTFGTASATSLATSESIKAYVDGQAGLSENLQTVTDNGNTTTNSIMIGSSSSPTQKLDVNGNINLGNNKKITFADSAGNAFTTIDYTNNSLFKIAQANSGELRLSVGFNDNSNNKITFFTQGSLEKMRITNDGNVLIGTTTDSGEKLVVDGTAKVEQYFYINDTGNTNNFSIRNESTYASISNETRTLNFIGGDKIFLNGSFAEAMRIKSSTGNLLINTTTDDGSSKLQVNGNSKLSGNVVLGTTGNRLEFTNGNVGLFRGDGSNLILGGFDGIIFRSSNSGITSQSERMRLTSGGNLLINRTSDAGSRVQVDGEIRIYNANFDINTDGRGYRFGAGDCGIFHTGFDMTFKNYNGSSLVENMRLTSSGNLLIGTTTDDGSSKLQVNGNVRIANFGQIYVNGTSDIFIGNTNSGVLRIGGDGTDTVIQPSFNNLIIKTTRDIDDIVFKAGASEDTYITLDSANSRVEFSKNLKISDNVFLLVGNGNDLQLLHNTIQSFIINETGDLTIRQNANDKDIIFQSDDGSGGITEYLRMDGGNTSIIATKNVELLDNVELKIGAGNDLNIRHNGSNSFIQNQTGNLTIQNATDDSDIIFKSDDGSGGITPYITLDGSAGQIHLQKTVGVGTTNPDTAYKIDIAGKAQVQDVLELDNVLTLNAISTPPNPDEGKSSIYMDSADGNIKVKINIEGTVVTRTIATFE